MSRPADLLRPCLPILALLGGCQPMPAQGLDPDFRPVLVGADLSAREVRPGDHFSLALRFRNDGTKAAQADYRVFVHFEAPEANCADIVFADDHEPGEPTTLWRPGEVVADDARILTAPADQPEREYFVHVGLFDPGLGGQRLLDTYDAGKIRVSRDAPPAESLAPPPLSPEAVAARRAALAARIPATNRVGLESGGWRFDLDRTNGAWALTDKATGALWTSDPARAYFAEVTLRGPDGTASWRVDRFDQVSGEEAQLRLVTRPLVDGQPAGVTVTFTLTKVPAPDGLRLAFASETTGGWQVSRVRLLSQALGVTEAETGRLYVPERLGIELPANQGVPGGQQWRTYDNLSMSMCGAVQDGSALLMTWDQVDTTLGVTTSWPDAPLVPGRRLRALSLEVDAPEGACSLHPLGRGGYVEIAQAYRPLAQAKGWRQTWAEKRRTYPTVDRMFGAMDFKPFVLSRTVPSSRFSPDGQEHVYLGFTFDEVAQCAEHWGRDLGIERAFVVLAGWINGGYDVRHPDILPAAPECGGDAGLAAACGRIRACGYLVGLHDNYQDMYEDAPSWDVKWLNKDAAGNPRMGGNWAGGQAWQVCAIEQVALAERPGTNLPRVEELFHPSIYFIDTVFAWPLVTCEDPAHPMSRADDLAWKTRLCLAAKQHFGLFGSEEGREWAVPCADYLEGLFSHQTASPVGTVIPLFPLVYSDCVQIMTHQGDRIGPGDEKKIADHILFAEMPLPSFGNHLYWTGPQAASVPIVPLAPAVRDLGGRRFEITYRWRVEGPVATDYQVFVHFTHAAATRPESIAYQGDHTPPVPTSQWKPGTVVEDGPFTLEVPPEFDGPAEIQLGMLQDGQRVQLSDVASNGSRYHVGTLNVGPDGIALAPAEAPPARELWTRGDGGWGANLCPTDRMIKNTWEVLSPLNTVTAERPLASHEFLTADRRLQRTRFGDVTITVGYEQPARIGDNAVPPYGFIVESPTFVAFCATRYNGIEYNPPALFTARSLDGKPIAESSQVRIYHGFGSPRISLGGKTFEVQREAVVAVR